MASKRLPGFTFAELLVAIIVSSILIGITISTYTLFRRSMARDQLKSDIVQNARITMDRLSREIRQAPDVVTLLPSSPSDTSVAEPGEIEFQDGHANDLTYKRYYVANNVLEMDTKEYYFASAPSIRVVWNATGAQGETPVAHVISTQTIADDTASIAFYGDAEITTVITTTDGGSQQFHLRTNILRRN